MKLAITSFDGPDAAIPLVMAHGLFGSGRNLGALARHLARDRRVISVDMRNHGDSPWSDDHGYAALAGDLAGVIDDLGGRAHVFGHSMGGKAAMMLALTHPEKVARLVVADIAPVAYGHSQNGLIDAMENLDRHDLTLRSEADRRLSTRIEDPGVRAFLLQSLDMSANPARWRFNLAALRDQMDRLVGWPDPAGQFDGPALFLDGETSDYIQPSHHHDIRGLFPQAQITQIDGAGHWLHAERPRQVEAAVASFLS
ncbi:alpha/beta fold hydrolase [Paracoccus sp. p3-h83]|uniref:alpha/beta fold hydrolase n=1 Tax=Paracoccus sp. p3-h83 TaxID=3342805 RepID=UPI0035BB833E